jgi:SAM-dependent methyltransferase
MGQEERNLTLERYIESSPLRDGFDGMFSRIAHEHRYRWLSEGSRSLGRVLEVGGGLGFAIPLLAPACRGLVEVDFNPAVLQRAAATTPAGVHFVVADCLATPFPVDTFDSAVGFEIIEHLERPGDLIAELRRVTRPNGLLYLSTPNRLERERKDRTMFEYHVREYSPCELRALITPHFSTVQLFGQRYVRPGVRRLQSHRRVLRLVRRLKAAIPARWRERLLHRLFPPATIAASWRITANDLETSDTLLAVCGGSPK